VLLAALDAGATVVTPNRRLARFLHREFDRVQRSRGHVAWPSASILPFSAWLGLLWEDALAGGALDDATVLLTPEQSALQWRQIVDADGERGPLFDGRGAAELAADAWLLVHQWGGGAESWRAWKAGEEALDDPAAFARWADAYLNRLRASAAIDIALVPDALARAAARLAWLPPTVLAGFVELTPQHERLVAALRGAGVAVQRMETLPEIAASATRTSALTPREEVASALAWARERVLARPEARIGIVVENLAARRDEVAALAEELLCPRVASHEAPARRPFEISLGPPLAAVPLVAAALDLIALGEGPLPAGEAAALLRSPYLWDAEVAWPTRARAERRWLKQGLLEATLTDAIDALERDSPALAARWRGARGAVRPRRSATPRECSDAWRAWLAAAGWPGSRPLDSEEYQARLKWEKLLVTFASLGAVAPRLSSARAIAILRTLAAEQAFQPEGGPAPIQILGLLEGTGLAFDALWVAGLASDRWPAAAGPNPLLPLAWQRQRGVAHATADREREYALELTARFARAAPEVVFSSAQSVDDHALSPSALILAYPEVSPAPRRASWVGDIARDAALEATTDDRAPPLAPGSKAPGGSRLVTSQSDCPFQAVVRCRLRAEPWPEPCPGLTPLERGMLVHVALARFWTALRDRATLIALDERTLASRVAGAIDLALREVAPSARRLLPALVRDGESARLERLLCASLAIERARPPFVTLALETSVTLQLGGLEFSLRRDRVDALDGGGVAIIDYKTGQVERPRQWFEERPRATQLGLYVLAQASAGEGARAVAYVELRPEAVDAVGLSADPQAWPALESVALAPGGSWPSLEAWWRRSLGGLAEEIATGHAAVAPRTTPSPCRSCRLHAVCRIESVRAIDPGDADD